MVSLIYTGGHIARTSQDRILCYSAESEVLDGLGLGSFEEGFLCLRTGLRIHQNNV